MHVPALAGAGCTAISADSMALLVTQVTQCCEQLLKRKQHIRHPNAERLRRCFWWQAQLKVSGTAASLAQDCCTSGIREQQRLFPLTQLLVVVRRA
jgi:hypothetical protein